MIHKIPYVDYIAAMAKCVPPSFSADAAELSTQLTRRLENEGIRATATGLLQAHKHILASLASTGCVPKRIPFFRGDFSSLPPEWLLDFTGMFSKLSVLGLTVPDDYDSFIDRSLEALGFDGVTWEDILPLPRGYQTWIRKRLRRAPSRVIPKHGPGTTAEHVIGYDKWWACDGALAHSNDPSRLSSVPKDFSKNRLIAIEPVQRQYIQQGIARALRATPLFRGICLDDVDGPRHLGLALKHGMTTIDLSDASDRIPPSLVEYLLPADWYALLIEHTAHSVEIPSLGERHLLGMFATMGCGYCFEVQSVIFRLVISIIGAEEGGYTLSEAFHRCHAFGDDIVIPEAWLPAILERFDRLGFRWNPRKTCHSPELFKETVGWWIVENKPYRRFLPELSGDRDHLIVSLVNNEDLALAERASNVGYTAVADCICRDRRVRIRWSVPLQRIEMHSMVSQAPVRDCSVPDAVRLKAYFFDVPIGRNERIEGSNPLIRNAWLPLWDYPYLSGRLPEPAHSCEEAAASWQLGFRL